MPLNFCANLMFLFNDTPKLLDRFDRATKAGFHAVECSYPIDASFDEIVSATTKAGVEQALLVMYMGRFKSIYSRI